MNVSDILQALNVLLIPSMIYIVKLERRMATLEGIADRVEKLERLILSRN